ARRPCGARVAHLCPGFFPPAGTGGLDPLGPARRAPAGTAVPRRRIAQLPAKPDIDRRRQPSGRPAHRGGELPEDPACPPDGRRVGGGAPADSFGLLRSGKALTPEMLTLLAANYDVPESERKPLDQIAFVDDPFFADIAIIHQGDR